MTNPSVIILFCIVVIAVIIIIVVCAILVKKLEHKNSRGTDHNEEDLPKSKPKKTGSSNPEPPKPETPRKMQSGTLNYIPKSSSNAESQSPSNGKSQNAYGHYDDE